MDRQSILSLTLIFCLVAAGVSSAHAQRSGDRPKIDTDGDGQISAEEFEQSPMSERVAFADVDANGDGVLTRDEIRRFMREKRGRRPQQ